MIAPVADLRERTQSASAMPEVSLVIPVFNEETSIDGLHARIQKVLETFPRRTEVIYVDDGSTDGSSRLLEALAGRDPRVTYVRLVRNSGQHAAILAGMEQSRGRIVVTLDADLQNPPEEIPRLVEKMDEGYDIVAGWRRSRQDSLLRTLPSRLLNQVVDRLMGCGLHDYGCMLRAYSRDVVDRLVRTAGATPFLPVLAISVAGKVTEIPVGHEERKLGDSKYPFRRLISLCFDLISDFSTLPLQLAGLLGLILIVLGSLVIGGTLVGWGSASGAVDLPLILSGLILLALGSLHVFLAILGEYVGRLHRQVQNRPRYLVERIRRGGDPA